jgi:hypothetical protein
MRNKPALAVTAAVLASLGLLAATRASTVAQGDTTGQERFVVFESFGRST